MQEIPLYVPILFGLTTLLTVYFFYKASRKSMLTLAILLIWLGAQAYIASSGFYTDTSTMPPKFILLPFPPILLIILLFVTPGGRRYIDGLDIRLLTLLHIVRIPVELVLFWLCLHKAVPQLMTFEGRNFDILSGITAPLLYYFVFVKKGLNRTVLLVWNFICLALLINIVAIAVLSAPFQFQQLAFDQPNIAVLYFPYVWLPCCVVPVVLLSHLAAIRQLTTGKIK